jgi:hypothetical protein
VATHFFNLLAKIHSDGRPGKEAIKTPLKRIYSYFGRIHRQSQTVAQTTAEESSDTEPITVVDDSEFERVQKQFADMECIYVEPEDRFRKPRDVFRDAVPFASPWWSQSCFGVANVELGLAFFGRKDRPDFADLCRLTCEIRASNENNLNEQEAAQFVRILCHIDETLPDDDPLPQICLLDDECQPVHATDLFIHDASWLDDKLSKNPVHLHHPQLPKRLMARLKLRRLSEHIRVEPEGEWPESKDAEFAKRCKSIENLLKSSELKKRSSAHFIARIPDAPGH